MNHVLDMLEELMVKVEQHEITYIIFSVIALLYLGAILDLICCVHITRHDLRAAEERLTDGHNKLAVRLQELEQAQKNSAVPPSTTSALPAMWALKPVCCRRTPSRRR